MPIAPPGSPMNGKTASGRTEESPGQENMGIRWKWRVREALSGRISHSHGYIFHEGLSLFGAS